MITYYLFDSANVLTGFVERKSVYHSFPTNSTRVPPPVLAESEYAVFNGESWDVVTDRPDPVMPVPNAITKRQARQQLIAMSMISSVQPVIDAIADPTERALVQSFWDDSTIYERNHPQMIALSAAIGMTESQLDDAFIAASLR